MNRIFFIPSSIQCAVARDVETSPEASEANPNAI
jgi:hypothetical protein